MKKNNENKWNILSIIVYAIIVLGMIIFHEQWRDEAQSWLIARDLDLFGLIKQMKYEGHFLLWYLILMPFAKLGFPYITENIISCVICIITSALILYKAPFSRLKRNLIIFSYPMIYLYPIIARCYCLIPLAITLICILYQRKYEKPKSYLLAIILLTNTHVIMLSLVAFLLIDFYIDYIKIRKEIGKQENDRIKISIWLAMSIIVLSGLPLLGCITTNKDIGSKYSIGIRIMNSLVLQPTKFVKSNVDFFFVSGILWYTLILYLIYYELKYYKLDFIKICVIILWQLFIYGFIYGMSSQRAGTVIFIILFFVWTRKDKKKEKIKIEKNLKNMIEIVLMSASVLVGIIYCCIDITFPYSSAKETAQYINQNIDKSAVILTGNQPEFCSSIMAYTNKVRFYYIQREDYFTYAILDATNRENLTREAFQNAKEKFKDKEIYYIYEPYKATESTDQDVIEELEKENEIIKIYESKESFKEEQFFIYKIVK